MHRLSAAKACFLSESTGDVPEPEVLIKLLDQVTTQFIEINLFLFHHVRNYYALNSVQMDVRAMK